MLKGYKGRILTANANLVSSTSSSGIWQMEEVFQGQASGGGSIAAATGGTLTTATIGGFTYNIHTFTTVGSNSINFSSGGPIDVLLVGGGGGGGSLGGGAAGGAVMNVSGTVASGTYSLTVGGGGSGALAWSTCCTAGSNTTGFGMTCFGGGSGCVYSIACLNTYNTSSQGNFGGRCYAATSYNNSPGTPSIASGWTGTVYAGYLGGTMTGSCCPCNGGGGAGAGVAGGAHTAPNGGNGIAINFTGSSYYWAGGGGGSGYCSQLPGNGGLGGGGGGGSTYSTFGTGGGSALNTGGNGTLNGSAAVGGAGGNNTGGGGGAGSTGSGTAGANGGNGGSGIIIVRYRNA